MTDEGVSQMQAPAAELRLAGEPGVQGAVTTCSNAKLSVL